MENVVFEFYRGDTYTRDFTISGFTMPISKIFFTVKEDENKKQAVLQKTLNDGITLVSDDENGRTYNLLICCVDTDKMKADFDYVFDIEIHSPGTAEMPIKKTIITGILRLKASATKTCNEC